MKLWGIEYPISKICKERHDDLCRDAVAKPGLVYVGIKRVVDAINIQVVKERHGCNRWLLSERRQR